MDGLLGMFRPRRPRRDWHTESVPYRDELNRVVILIPHGVACVLLWLTLNVAGHSATAGDVQSWERRWNPNTRSNLRGG